MGNGMLGHEIGCGIYAWVGPTTTRVGLVMGVGYQFPGLAQLLPMWPLTGERRSTGESVESQKSSCDSGRSTPSNPVAHHSRMIYTTHHLAAWTMIFANACGLPNLHGITANHPRRHRSDPNRSPGSRCMVIGAGVMLCQPGAVAYLIGQCQIGREILASHTAFIGQSQKRRKNRRSRMALARGGAIMGVDAVNRHRAGHRCAGQTC